MITVLLRKEMLSVLGTPKTAALLIVCAALIIASVTAGLKDYRESKRIYEESEFYARSLLVEQSDWARAVYRVYREPDPVQILISGTEFDVGRWSPVSDYYVPRLRGSAYSEDTIFAVFRRMDLAMIVMLALSLLALVVSHDAICGEREAGTLRLVFANAVPRGVYLFAKCAGCWLAITVPLLVPLLLSILILQMAGVLGAAAVWLKLAAFILLSGLVVTFFVVLGVLISALSKRSSISFLVGLLCWLVLVFIYPRIAVLTASEIVRVPSVGTLEAQRTAFSSGQWAAYRTGVHGRMREYFKDYKPSDSTWKRAWIDSCENVLREDIERSVREFETKLVQDQRRRQTRQQEVVSMLCLGSPATVYQMGAMALAGTDIGLKQRTETALDLYRDEYLRYLSGKEASQENQNSNVVTVYSREGRSISISVPMPTDPLDLNDIPAFTTPATATKQLVHEVARSAGLLALYSLAALACAFAAFNRYDLR